MSPQTRPSVEIVEGAGEVTPGGRQSPSGASRGNISVAFEIVEDIEEVTPRGTPSGTSRGNTSVASRGGSIQSIRTCKSGVSGTSSGTVRYKQHLCDSEHEGGGASTPRSDQDRSFSTARTMQRLMLQNNSFYIERGPFGNMRIFLIQSVLSSNMFEAAMGFVIVLNSLSIGIELSEGLAGRNVPGIAVLENLFLATYIGELGLRFLAMSHIALRDNWVKFDLFIVVVGVFSTWIADLIKEGPDVGFMMVLRVARLFRLARPLRLLVKFRDLWILVRGLLDSAGTMFYTLVMLTILLYIFACVGVEIISSHSLAVGDDASPEFKAVVDENFNSVASIIFTLIQFACLDGIIDVCKPLILQDWTLAPYFIACFLVIGIVQMNLITAVIVNGAFARVDEDKEVVKASQSNKQMKLIKDLRKLFLRLDADESGTITLDEIDALNEDDRTLLYNCLTTSNPVEIFAALDVDESGALDIDELCDGIWQVSISKAPIEIKRMEKQVEAMRVQLRNVGALMGQIQATIANTNQVLIGLNSPAKTTKLSANAHAVSPDGVKTKSPKPKFDLPEPSFHLDKPGLDLQAPLLEAQLVEQKLRVQDSLSQALLAEEDELAAKLRSASAMLANEVLEKLQLANEALQQLSAASHAPGPGRRSPGPEACQSMLSPPRPQAFLRQDRHPEVSGIDQYELGPRPCAHVDDAVKQLQL